MWLGWKTLPIDEQGYPTEYATGWVAECFVLFTFVIWVGEVKRADPYDFEEGA